MKTKKKFDCVDFQHEEGERLLEKFGSMTREQQLEYWRKQTAQLRERQRLITARRKRA